MGEFELSLNVKSMENSKEFYEKLGFIRIDGDGCTWALLGNGNLKIGIYQGHVNSNLLTFWGGNVYQKAEELKSQGIQFETEPILEPDGLVGAVIADPDGNRIYMQAKEEECK
jgi:predicted enzyme related to lactoylglutathione lyase